MGPDTGVTKQSDACTGDARPTLGVVAISYNEAQDLPWFMSHLEPWVDEIVIVDDGSTDDTAAIAAQAGRKVKLISDPRRKGEFFSHQRNKGIDAATSEWLLHMDIDERVPPELAKELLSAITDDKCDALRYRRLNFFLHRPMHGGGWRDWNQVHLARRHVLRFQGMYHERVALNTTDDRIGQLQHEMLHLNDASYQERLHKSDRYLEEIVSRLRAGKREITVRRLLFAPVKEFLTKYFLKQGFRDGTMGLIWALHAATALFRAHVLAWDERNSIPREKLEQGLSSQWKEADPLKHSSEEPNGHRKSLVRIMPGETQ